MKKKVALTGGIATGKTTVANMFAELGAIILDADQVARDVVRPGTPCWQKLKDLLGPDFFDHDGQLKRRELRSCIIQNDACRAQVNAILHPAIISVMEAEWGQWQQRDPRRVVLYDIPLLFESGLAQRFDIIILVYASPQIQVQRLAARDGVSPSEAERTLGMQLPIDSKKALADIVIDNSLDPVHTLRQVRAAWERLQTSER